MDVPRHAEVGRRTMAEEQHLRGTTDTLERQAHRRALKVRVIGYNTVRQDQNGNTYVCGIRYG